MESHDSEFAVAGGYGPGPAQPGASTEPAARIWDSGYMVADDAQRQAGAKAGHDAAVTMITRQAGAGMTPEQIADHQHDVSAWLLSEAETPDAQSYAAAYDSAARALAADLIQDARMREGAAPMAARLQDGTPHSDPALAAKGLAGRRRRVRAQARTPGRPRSRLTPAPEPGPRPITTNGDTEDGNPDPHRASAGQAAKAASPPGGNRSLGSASGGGCLHAGDGP
jgi:hypothetical protein